MTLHHNVGLKCNLVNGLFPFLCHKCLCHTGDKMERLTKNMDFIDINLCMNCIKEKKTKQYIYKEVTRNAQLLKIVYIEIYGPFIVTFIEKER